MNNKEEFKLTEGSRYKIISISGRENALETIGVFKGFATIGLEEAGLQIELDENHGEMKGIIRIVPLHAILAIDILNAKEIDIKEDTKDTHQFYG